MKTFAEIAAECFPDSQCEHCEDLMELNGEKCQHCCPHMDTDGDRCIDCGKSCDFGSEADGMEMKYGGDR